MNSGARQTLHAADAEAVVLAPLAAAGLLLALALRLDGQTIGGAWRGAGAWRGTGAWAGAITTLRPLRSCRRERHSLLDAALGVASFDAEVTVLAPVRVPAVGDLPVFVSGVHSPADDAHRMPALHAAAHVVVDARHIVGEI